MKSRDPDQPAFRLTLDWVPTLKYKTIEDLKRSISYCAHAQPGPCLPHPERSYDTRSHDATYIIKHCSLKVKCQNENSLTENHAF